MTGRARVVPVRLTIKRRRKLEQIIAAATSPQRLVLRARIVLAARGWDSERADCPRPWLQRGGRADLAAPVRLPGDTRLVRYAAIRAA